MHIFFVYYFFIFLFLYFIFFFLFFFIFFFFFYVFFFFPGPDGLDRWAAERDLKETTRFLESTFSRDTPGYSDLMITETGAMNRNTATFGIP